MRPPTPGFAFRQSWEARRRSVARKWWRSFPDPMPHEVDIEVGLAGFAIVGMTVAKTEVGGKELVAITKRDKQGP